MQNNAPIRLWESLGLAASHIIASPVGTLFTVVYLARDAGVSLSQQGNFIALTFPDRVVEPFTVPLITDFDEASRTFTYDSAFGLKNPDWTYSPPIRKAKVATPAKVAQGDFAIRMDPDVANVLLKMAEEQGIALDRLANRLLRDTLNTK